MEEEHVLKKKIILAKFYVDPDTLPMEKKNPQLQIKICESEGCPHVYGD